MIAMVRVINNEDFKAPALSRVIRVTEAMHGRLELPSPAPASFFAVELRQHQRSA